MTLAEFLTDPRDVRIFEGTGLVDFADLYVRLLALATEPVVPAEVKARILSASRAIVRRRPGGGHDLQLEFADAPVVD